MLLIVHAGDYAGDDDDYGDNFSDDDSDDDDVGAHDVDACRLRG